MNNPHEFEQGVSGLWQNGHRPCNTMLNGGMALRGMVNSSL